MNKLATKYNTLFVSSFNPVALPRNNNVSFALYAYVILQIIFSPMRINIMHVNHTRHVHHGFTQCTRFYSTTRKADVLHLLRLLFARMLMNTFDTICLITLRPIKTRERERAASDEYSARKEIIDTMSAIFALLCHTGSNNQDE